MIRSHVVTIGPDPTPLPLGEARGFALASYEGGNVWPVAVTLRVASGEETLLLVREGVWYALADRVVSASAQLPAGSDPTTYQLDHGRTREDAALPVAAPASESQFAVEEFDSPPGAAAGWKRELARPAWASRVEIIVKAVSQAGTNPQIGVRAILPSGFVWNLKAPAANVNFPRYLFSLSTYATKVATGAAFTTIETNQVGCIPDVLEVFTGNNHDPGQFVRFAVVWGR